MYVVGKAQPFFLFLIIIVEAPSTCGGAIGCWQLSWICHPIFLITTDIDHWHPLVSNRLQSSTYEICTLFSWKNKKQNKTKIIFCLQLDNLQLFAVLAISLWLSFPYKIICSLESWTMYAWCLDSTSLQPKA